MSICSWIYFRKRKNTLTVGGSRVGATTAFKQNTRAFLKLTLKLRSSNHPLKQQLKKCFAPLRRDEHLQQDWHAQHHHGRVDCHHHHHCCRKEKGWREQGQTKSRKLRCAPCGDMSLTHWTGPNPGSWK